MSSIVAAALTNLAIIVAEEPDRCKDIAQPSLGQFVISWYVTTQPSPTHPYLTPTITTLTALTTTP